MTTARALLRRLLRHGRIDPAVAAKAGSGGVGAGEGAAEGAGEGVPGEEAGSETGAGERLEAARERLKRTIPPPGGAEGGSSPVPNDPPSN
jgi:hypothetical protein